MGLKTALGGGLRFRQKPGQNLMTQGEIISGAIASSATVETDSISIDPETRDIVQTIYIRRVEKVAGKLQNVEFDQIANFKDPGKP